MPARMTNHNRLKIILLIAAFIGGCSTLELQDAYTTTETKKNVLLDLKQEDVELRIGINPQTRFYSMGILGTPVVPTYVKPADTKEIQLGISLNLRHERDFSFAARPCLGINAQDTLCPHEIEISAVGLFQDDGSMYRDKQKRWQKISNFYDPNNQVLRLAPDLNTTRIDRQLIYKHYVYSGTPQFGYLRVSVTYKYQCADNCPERMTVNTNDLVALDRLPIEARNFTLEKSKQSKYRATTLVQ